MSKARLNGRQCLRGYRERKKDLKVPKGATSVSYLYNAGKRMRNCHVICYADGRMDLSSYKLIVARWTADGVFVKKWGGWSATTMKHVNEFRVRLGLPRVNKKEWDAMVCA